MNIGTIYQGQTISIVMKTDWVEELEGKYVYLGIYNEKHRRIFLVSTKDGNIASERVDDKIFYNSTLPSSITKLMNNGTYSIELLIKNDDESYVNICNDVIYFKVSSRYITEVLK